MGIIRVINGNNLAEGRGGGGKAMNVLLRGREGGRERIKNVSMVESNIRSEGGKGGGGVIGENTCRLPARNSKIGPSSCRTYSVARRSR